MVNGAADSSRFVSRRTRGRIVERNDVDRTKDDVKEILI